VQVAHDVNWPQDTGPYDGPGPYPPSSIQAAGSSANNKVIAACFTMRRLALEDGDAHRPRGYSGLVRHDRARSDALVFFGATGDLAYKKIFPALQAMARRGRLDFPVVGVAKAGWTAAQLVERARASLAQHGGGVDEAAFKTLAQRLDYVDGDYADADTFVRLRAALGAARRPTHYLAIPPSVCPVTIHQPMDDVHGALIDYLKRSVLTSSVLDTVVSAIRDEVTKLLSAGAKDVTGLEKELAGLRAEQKRLARAVATAGDDIPELVAELRLRNDRIRRLEADLVAARRSPAMVADVLARAETAARAKLADLRTALDADLPAMREVFQSLFPEGLTFLPAANTPRRVWAISGTARLDSLKLSSDPSGIRTRVHALKGHCPGPG
jgi:hypothetical protein